MYIFRCPLDVRGRVRVSASIVVEGRLLGIDHVRYIGDGLLIFFLVFSLLMLFIVVLFVFS